MLQKVRGYIQNTNRAEVIRNREARPLTASGSSTRLSSPACITSGLSNIDTTKGPRRDWCEVSSIQSHIFHGAQYQDWWDAELTPTRQPQLVPETSFQPQILFVNLWPSTSCMKGNRMANMFGVPRPSVIPFMRRGMLHCRPLLAETAECLRSCCTTTSLQITQLPHVPQSCLSNQLNRDRHPSIHSPDAPSKLGNACVGVL
jgi:hypothetical protein